MKQMLQPDFHPDAASLNAFVEHVLLEPERGVVLTHIASCRRCRQIVYLAQDAASDAEPIASSPSAGQRPPWRGNWRWAWISVAALATGMALVVSVQLRHKTPNSAGFAKISPAPATLSDSTKSVHTESAVAEPGVPLTLILPPAAGEFRPFHEKAKAMHPLPLPLVAVIGADRPSPPLAGQAPPSPEEASARGILARDKLPPAAVKPTPAAAGEDWSPRPSSQTSAAGSVHGANPVSRPSRGAIGADAAPPAAGSIYANVLMSSAPGPDAAVARNVMYTRLPTGLPAVSTAANQHHLLAVDSSGALFLSEDAGKVWAPVTRQWTGRAIEVRVPEYATPAQARAQAMASFHRGSSAAPASDTLFQIVNDADAVWISSDGKTWKAK